MLLGIKDFHSVCFCCCSSISCTNLHHSCDAGVLEGKESVIPEQAEPAPADKTTREQRYVSGQYFFEYLVVVTLNKSKQGVYEPQITYQFPKVSLPKSGKS